MKRITLEAAVREEFGSKDSRHLRAENKVPCVMYGGEEPKHFVLDEVTLNKYVFTPEVFLYEVELGGEKFLASIIEVQFHPVSDRPIHVDFRELKEDEKARVAVPVKLLGTPVGVRNGGRLNQNYRKVTIEGLPANLPEFLEVSVDEIKIGQSIRIGEIDAEGLKIMEDPEKVLMTVKMARTVIEEEELEDEEGEEGEEGAEGGEGEDGKPAAEGASAEGDGDAAQEKKDGGE